MYFAAAKYTSSHVNYQFISIFVELLVFFPGETSVKLLYLLVYLDLSVSPAGKNKQTFQRVCSDLCILKSKSYAKLWIKYWFCNVV